MSMTPEDAAYEEYLDALYREWQEEYAETIKEQGIAEFINERFRDYFVRHPDVAAAPYRRHQQAVALMEHSADAALVLAASSMEVGFKNLTLRPIIHGLIHDEKHADLLTEMIVRSSRPDDYKKLVRIIMENINVTDEGGMTICEHKATFFQHYNTVWNKRNGVIHRAENATEEEAKYAVQVSHFIVKVLFPRLIEVMGLGMKELQVKTR